ncbi:MAG: hypothetical protein NVS3B10_09200 [Polyangiales bacterium]
MTWSSWARVSRACRPHARSEKPERPRSYWRRAIVSVGTETATVWSGYIDGAISSGKRAAAEIVAAG